LIRQKRLFIFTGMSDADVHVISTIENPSMGGGRFTGGSSDDSSQSSAPPMTGLVQPQQPHWPQHPTTHNHHHLHSSSYILDGDDDPDDFDYDDYSGGPGTPSGPPSPGSSSGTRSKRGSSTKRISHSVSRKIGNNKYIYLIHLSFFIIVGSGSGSGGTSITPPTGNRRQQYTLAELPFVCEFCPARYKTKPGLQYHLAKHKDTNTDYRPSPSTPSTADSCGSSSPSSTNTSATLMKQKYMSPSIDHQQHPMYPNHPPPGGPPGMSGTPYQMNHHHHQQPPPPPYSMQSHSHHQSMPPSASMPLTVAALSGSSPASCVPYYSQQQHPMMHQQHMMMMQQQQQQQHMQHHQQYQQQQPLPPSKPSASAVDPTAGITIGMQCDFCGGDEQENKTTKLPEQMITCKVISIDYYSSSSNFICSISLGLWWFCASNLS
jgi:hypothetical protein